MNARKVEIERVNDHFNKTVAQIMDPGKEEREQRMLEENPLFAAGMRGLDNLKWEFEGQRQVAEIMRRQSQAAA